MTSNHRNCAARAFGQALKAARTERGMSQEEVAGECEFDRTYPSLLERGRWRMSYSPARPHTLGAHEGNAPLGCTWGCDPRD
jgi:transcriptional regulator with XRE-family HTH domain